MSDPTLYIVLCLIGLLAGSVGGLLGVGGSIIMIPALTEFLGPNQHLYQATAMIVNFFVVVPAVIRHRRAGAIQWPAVYQLLPFALLAVVIGVGISELAFFSGRGEAYLRLLFGLFLMTVATIDLLRLIRPRPQPQSGDNSKPINARTGWRLAGLVAVPTGLIAGLFGIGGGLVAVPLQRRVLGIPIRRAIANSATIIIVTSLAGAFTKNYAYITQHEGRLDSLRFAAILIPTAILGSWIGATGTHRLPIRGIRIAFFLLIAAAAIRLTHRAWQDLAGA